MVPPYTDSDLLMTAAFSQVFGSTAGQNFGVRLSLFSSFIQWFQASNMFIFECAPWDRMNRVPCIYSPSCVFNTCFSRCKRAQLSAAMAPMSCRAIAGASLWGAKMLIEDRAGTVIHWEGGRHHAKPAEASGFCYVRNKFANCQLIFYFVPNEL